MTFFIIIANELLNIILQKAREITLNNFIYGYISISKVFLTNIYGDRSQTNRTSSRHLHHWLWLLPIVELIMINENISENTHSAKLAKYII